MRPRGVQLGSSMRCPVLLFLALITTPASASGTLFANDLALQCSSQEREKRLICEAFVDGFLAGLSTDGNACPTPEASEETIAALLAVPRATGNTGSGNGAGAPHG